MEEPRPDAEEPTAAPDPAPAPPEVAPTPEAPSAESAAVDAVQESDAPAGDVPAMETAAVVDAPADAAPTDAAPAPSEAEQPAAEGSEAPAEGEQKLPLGKIKKMQQSQAHRPKRRRGRGGEGQAAQGEGGEGAPQGEGAKGQGGGGGQRRRGGKPGGSTRPPRPPREKGPLPFNELRDAARSIMQQHGEAASLRVAVAELAPKERGDISELVSNDGDFRVRARSISAGSLAAGKLGKALAAQQIAIADVKDLWPLFLSKEEAAERQAFIRNAKRRDDERAKRQAERRNSADRISKEDMEKARDGRVGAQIRFVIAGEKDPRDAEKAAKADEPAAPKKKTTAADLLDRLGY